MCGQGYTATKQDEGKQSNELMHSHVQYIKSLTVQTHFKNKNLVLTEEGQHASDTITQSTPVKKITLDLKALTICSYELIKIFVFNVT